LVEVLDVPAECPQDRLDPDGLGVLLPDDLARVASDPIAHADEGDGDVIHRHPVLPGRSEVARRRAVRGVEDRVLDDLGQPMPSRSWGRAI
jgi:hypothetical protein